MALFPKIVGIIWDTVKAWAVANIAGWTGPSEVESWSSGMSQRFASWKGMIYSGAGDQATLKGYEQE